MRENKNQIDAVELAIRVGTATTPSQKAIFTIKCPDACCRGFLDSKFVCGTCETPFCKDCHEKLTDDHVCDENTKATIKMLAKDTKSCPSCSTPIHKIHGCDQMFCTQCNTAFSWQTGQIETRNIHNPHYYEWVRQGNGNLRQPGDAVCGGLPHLYSLQNVLVNQRNKKLITNEQDGKIRRYHRMISHIHNVELRHFRVDVNNDNTSLRIAYLLQEIDAAEFKRKLQAREKQRSIKREIYQILSMIDEIGTVEFVNLMSSNKAPNAFTTLENTIAELITYATSEFAIIAKRYNIKPFQLYV